ncbi:hypothetical protein SUGI_0824160 [Cryptomeria japonica]|nr:hypothetical protein SUGI_0824160 [Cryptomeria japonica]
MCLGVVIGAPTSFSLLLCHASLFLIIGNYRKFETREEGDIVASNLTPSFLPLTTLSPQEGKDVVFGTGREGTPHAFLSTPADVFPMLLSLSRPSHTFSPLLVAALANWKQLGERALSYEVGELNPHHAFLSTCPTFFSTTKF